MRSLLLTPIDRWLAPAPLPKRVGWLGQWTYAHRGLHGDSVPENSPAAFDAAIAAGYGIECDVQRSGDGRAVVFHDWELDRLTGETGPLSARTAHELAKIALSGNGERIRSLEQALEQIGGKVPVLIEIKSRNDRRVRPLCLAVHRALEGYQGHHAVMSFDPRVSRWFARHSLHTVRGLVVTEENARTLVGRWRRHSALWIAKPDFLAYDIRDLPSAFASAQRRRGLPVLSWTIRSAVHRDLVSLHADAAIAEGEGLAGPKPERERPT
ncbi:glycerophosphodiester phosphodiesterase family protein [Allopontixanthobacter sp.]|uniref:glycerophosphodiester phosphodiesterase family protein n=1 Tax=Allopontixanthobacter sp. TaxID=2906452 RepID=UPI002ABD1218|nr:glycerophosphodiester phosphodiesterase family protein [Allopontixanthobacter sp.]MDZ4308817.1 glycerophosphodiester phosphodiesterase family protein [Allopontixanthobacter sp.]